MTQVISPWVDFSRISPEVLEAAADRGTRAHRACAAMTRGLWCRVDADVAGYVDSFRKWHDVHVVSVVGVELNLTHDGFGYCGHPDLIVTMGGHNVLVDLKTPRAVAPSWRLQLAAYRELAQHCGYSIDRTGSLRLHPDGGPAVFDDFTATHGQDFQIFLSTLNVWRYFHG